VLLADDDDDEENSWPKGGVVVVVARVSSARTKRAVKRSGWYLWCSRTASLSPSEDDDESEDDEDCDGKVRIASAFQRVKVSDGGCTHAFQSDGDKFSRSSDVDGDDVNWRSSKALVDNVISCRICSGLMMAVVIAAPALVAPNV